uniref:Uncharacterized protein n=1 Tax=Strigamia maritima TaxID=126957 RepID=T1JJZ7_STRMM
MEAKYYTLQNWQCPPEEKVTSQFWTYFDEEIPKAAADAHYTLLHKRKAEPKKKKKKAQQAKLDFKAYAFTHQYFSRDRILARNINRNKFSFNLCVH